MAWLARQDSDAVAITSVTMAEVLEGLARLPAGKRRASLEAKFRAFLADVLGDRVLSFDRSAAAHFARLSIRRRSMGRPTSALDTMVLAIAAETGSTVATRNVADFAHCGIPLINPWAR
jgi:hypothetical protein